MLGLKDSKGFSALLVRLSTSVAPGMLGLKDSKGFVTLLDVALESTELFFSLNSFSKLAVSLPIFFKYSSSSFFVNGGNILSYGTP